MLEKDTKNPVPCKRIRMCLNTHERARKALARLIREFRQDEIENRDVAGFRALVYSFSTLLQFFSFQKNIEIEERIQALEKKLEDLGK